MILLAVSATPESAGRSDRHGAASASGGARGSEPRSDLERRRKRRLPAELVVAALAQARVHALARLRVQPLDVQVVDAERLGDLVQRQVVPVVEPEDALLLLREL